MKKTIFTISFALFFPACSPQVTQMQPADQAQPIQEESPQQANEAGGETPARTFTLTEIAEHNVEADCWLAIDGGVYDVTGFIASGNHGGGDAIIQGCGKDATELFETRPMGSGTPHSSTARDFLPSFKIGELTE